jgi:SAM-dependent methyltransferase
MDRDEISRIAHAQHPIAAPVASGAVDALLASLAPAPTGRVLDLGCGGGAWLVRLLGGRPDVQGVGVDLSARAIAEARHRSAEEQVSDRARWVEADASTWADGPFDAVICVGASHVFGGLAATLAAVRGHLDPGGGVLLGDAFWEAPPSQAAQDALEAGPDDFPDLEGLVATTRQHDFEVGYGHVSTLEEWDDYEWSWTGSLVGWALHDAPTPGEREAALGAATAHRDAWLGGYRRELGFVTLVLHDTAQTAS